MSARLSITGPRIGLLAPLSLAEACLATPALRAIDEQNSHQTVILFCPENQAPLWSIHFQNLVTYADQANLGELISLFSQQDLNTALFFESSPAAKAISKIPVPHRLGPRIKSINKLLTDAPPPQETVGPPRHRVTHYLSFAEGLSCPVDQPHYFAPPPLPARPITPIIGLAPDSDLGPAAEWPTARFLEVAKGLAGTGCAITLFSFGQKAERARSLSSALKGDDVPHDLHLEHQLPELLAILPTVSTLLCSHGTLAHLAAYTGLPTVSLMGSHSPLRDRPLGRIHHSLTSHAECSPCHLAKCPLDHRCLLDLPADQVQAAVLKILTP